MRTFLASKAITHSLIAAILGLLVVSCSKDTLPCTTCPEPQIENIWPDSSLFEAVSLLPSAIDSALKVVLPTFASEEGRCIGIKLSNGQFVWLLGTIFGIHGVEVVDTLQHVIFRQEMTRVATRVQFANGDGYEVDISSGDTIFTIFSNVTVPMSSLSLKITASSITLEPVRTHIYLSVNPNYGNGSQKLTAMPPLADIKSSNTKYLASGTDLSCEGAMSMLEQTLTATCLVQDWTTDFAEQAIVNACNLTASYLPDILDGLGISSSLQTLLSRQLGGICSVAGGGKDWSGWLDVLTSGTKLNPLSAFCTGFETTADLYSLWNNSGAIEDFTAWLCSSMIIDESSPARWEPPSNWQLPGFGERPENCGFSPLSSLQVTISGSVGNIGIGGNATASTIYGSGTTWGNHIRVRIPDEFKAPGFHSITFSGDAPLLISCSNGAVDVRVQSKARLSIWYQETPDSPISSCGFDGNSVAILSNKTDGTTHITVCFEPIENENGASWCTGATPLSGCLVDGVLSKGELIVE